MECISLVNKEKREGRNTPSHFRRRADLPRLGEGDMLTTSGSTEKVSSSRESTESDGEVVTTDLLSSSSCRIDKESLSDVKGKTDRRRFSSHQEQLRVNDRCFCCGEKVEKTVPNSDPGLKISVNVTKKTFRVSIFIVSFFLTVAILRICKQCFTCWTF